MNSSCLTTSPVEPVEEKARYVETDVADVEEAKATIEVNKNKRIELINKGAERAERFEPLILSLIAYHEYDQELSLDDVSPFIAELPHIASISTYKEKQEFIRLGTEDSISTKKVISEAEKGADANKYVKQLKARINELEEEKKGKVTEKTMVLGSAFMGVGGIAMALSVFTTLNLIAGISSSIRKMGATLIAVGGIIMAFGIFTDSLQEFLKDYGDLAIGIPVAIFIICFGYSRMRKTKIDIDEYEEDANNDEA